MYGTLSDTEIQDLVESGTLIIENFKAENLSQACYEVTAGNTYFDLSNGGKQYKVNEGDDIVFKPHQTIVIISKEKFEIPDDILARFLTKGALFSVGFTPVNTYADPGFYGKMGIVMTNASNNYLKIPSGHAIAKVEFSRLQTPAKNTYHGQHGFETGIWPIKTEYIIERENLKEYFPNYDEVEEIKAIYGESVANIVFRILKAERHLLGATVILIIINLVIIGFCAGTGWLGTIGNLCLSIASNIVYAIIMFFINNPKRKRGKK